jgi:hypothetical protein
VETPDFDQIALGLMTLASKDADISRMTHGIAAQLRQVWNLRGAADCEAIDMRLSALTGWVTSEPYRKQLREAIEAADVPRSSG